MALFQQSIIKKYLQELDNNSVNAAFDKFYKHFGNTERQNNIRELKEEQYQEGFLRELFVNILGYTINPEPNYNLLTEQKNEKDSKKADGAIINQGANAPSIIAVIELKGTDTTDLSKVENQAFGYKNNQKDCKYVITSNFEKLRFYIDNAIDFEEFNLFNLTKERFQLLFLCLAKDNLLNGIPQKIKEASVSQEENITKKLYSDYSTFKKTLYQNLVELNPQYDKLTLFKKTQKLLDRFLFIFFAEDRLLLPPNSIQEIIKQWNQLKDLDNYTPLYDRFKKYFGYMNTGFKGKQYEIFAYNGGFFAPDEILDNIKIDDIILHDHTLRLSNYDFDTEVDVNILGHIFEHSLNEIEEIQSEIEGKELDKSKTKRKKDGVFYTPKYITKYIVENTVGALCTEKKIELGINDEEIIISKRKDKKKELIEKIDTYRNWLLKLTICDPACGSGAFLNQALDYLLIEHKKLDELKARITNSPMIISDIENSVLENNIFGVDLNDEAVEIARLSLWLKTAQKGRKLSNLSDNIKCGNSLIDDKNIAGEKAFSWKKEFPEIFDNGGFDVVIGNPPYGAKFNKEEINYYNNIYQFQSYQLDSYLLFTEKLLELIKKNGFGSYIMPNTWLSSLFADKIRNFVLNNFSILEINHYSYFVFVDATVETDTYIFRKDESFLKNLIQINIIENKGENIYKQLNQSDLINTNGKPINIFEKKEYESIKLKIQKHDKLGNIALIIQGTKPFQKGKGNPKQDENTLLTQPYVKTTKVDESFKPLLRGSLINRYQIFWDNDYWISYGDWLAEPRYSAKFESSEKIVIRQTGDSLIATYDENKFIARDNLYVIRVEEGILNLKFILVLLNSNFLTWYFRKFLNPEEGKAMAQVKRGHLADLPIPQIQNSSQLHFISKADKMLSLNKELRVTSQKFQRTLQRKFDFKELSKFDNWYSLSYSEFIKELSKIKVKLSLSEESEWEEYFNQEANKSKSIKSEIYKLDKEIDKMVYELYELTEEEIGIIEKI